MQKENWSFPIISKRIYRVFFVF